MDSLIFRQYATEDPIVRVEGIVRSKIVQKYMIPLSSK